MAGPWEQYGGAESAPAAPEGPWSAYQQSAAPAAPSATPAPAAAAPEGTTTSFVTGNLNKGIAGIAGMPVDFTRNLVNLGIAAYGAGTGRGAAAPEPLAPGPGSSHWFEQMMRKGGAINQGADPTSKGGEYAASALQMLPAAAMGRPTNPVQAFRSGTAATTSGLAGQAGADIGGEEWRGPASMAPGAFSMQHKPPGERATAERKAETFGKAKDMGIPIPPRAMKEDPAQQSMQNAANRHLGQPEGTAITPETLNAYRGALQGDYNAAFKSPALSKGILPNRAFRDALNQIEQEVTAGASQFPQTFKGMGEVTKLLADYRQGAPLPPATALRAIKKLRSDATTNFTSDKPEQVELARAQKKIATAVEDLVESSLGADKALMGKFREARTAMAKSYDIEAALDPTTRNISGQRLSQMLTEGKPISGGMRDLAEVGGAFPGALKTPPEGDLFSKRMSPFGVTHPGALAAHAATKWHDPLTLSRPYQSLMVDPRNKLSPEQERGLRYMLAAMSANRGQIPAPPQ